MTRLIWPYDWLLNDAAGWQALELTRTTLSDGVIALAKQPGTTIPIADASNSFGGFTLPRGVAIWNQTIFIADPPRHRILQWRPCCGPASPVPNLGGAPEQPVTVEGCWNVLPLPSPEIGARQLLLPLGLAISHRDDLVIADAERRCLLLLTLPGFALRRILGPFKNASGVEWKPVDVARGPKGTLYVADASGQIWKLDSQGRPDRRYDGLLPEGAVPRRLVIDCQERAYLLLEGKETVLLLDRYGKIVRKDDKPEEDALDVGSLDEALDAATGETLRSRLPATRLLLDGDNILLAPGNPRECWREPEPTDLTIDADGRLILSDVTTSGVSDAPLLLRRPPRVTYEVDGLFRVQPLDSDRVGNAWHRIILEFAAPIPDRTGVRLFTFTSDVPRPDVSASGLLEEPANSGNWQAAPDNVDEWLIQSPPGRYLYIAIAFKGAGDDTPRLQNLTVYAHRQTSMQYLPAVFQADDTSRDLLDRLLSLTDTIFQEIESEIEDFPLYLSLKGAPADFLPWLASWFDLDLEKIWTDAQRREILRNIIPLYRRRGTLGGLRQLLQLHANLSDPLPQIVENFRVTGNPALETWIGGIQKDEAHHFTVVMPFSTLDTEDKRTVVQRLIDTNRPAHTHFTLRPITPGVRLGSASLCGSALGINSVLGSLTDWRLPTEPLSGDTSETILSGARILPAAPMPRAVAVRVGSTRLGT